MGAEYLEHIDNVLGPVDWTVFFIALLGATLVGFYFGYWRKDKVTDQSETPDTKAQVGANFESEKLDEYFTGKAQMKAFPVGMTLVGSYISAVTILGTPAEMYQFGTQQMMVVVAIALSSLVVAYGFVPVFMNLKINSSYDYLEMRFDKSVHFLVSILFIVDNIFFMPVCIYIPVVAMQMLTGIHYMISATVMVVVVVLYTTLGGVKVVVYTDTWQIYIMFFSVVFAVCVATWETGGLGKVVQDNSDGGRWIFFDFDPSLYKRYTIWSVVIGNACYWIAFNSVNQTMVQRYKSLPSVNKARLALLYFSIAMILFEIVIYFGGIAMYSYFKDCDPLGIGIVEKTDHLYSKYLLYSVGWMQGLPGLFLSGAFGGSLSSLSVIYNSLSLVLYNDIVKGIFRAEFSERNATIFVKCSVILFGILSILGTPIINTMDTVFAVAIGLTAICNSTIFSIFFMGMFFPIANRYGAYATGIVGFTVTTLSTAGTHVVQQKKEHVKPTLVMTNDLCPQYNFTEQYIPEDSDVFPFFKVGYLWVNLTGIIFGTVAGLLVSLVTGPNKARDHDAALFSPAIHMCLPDECFEGSVIKRKKKKKDEE